MDAARSGAALGMLVLLALCSALLQKSIKGGLIATGGLTLGGGVETVPNAGPRTAGRTALPTSGRRPHGAPGRCVIDVCSAVPVLNNTDRH